MSRFNIGNRVGTDYRCRNSSLHTDVSNTNLNFYSDAVPQNSCK